MTLVASDRRQRGVTLIEMMITLVVLVVILAFSVPSFLEFRQRSALRGAADQLSSFWGDARFEALRRNRLLAVTFLSRVDGGICLGADDELNDPDSDVGCDCFTAGACNVASYPADQAEWRGVRVAANPTMGDVDTDVSGVVVIDPKRGDITDPADAGRFFLQAPANGPLDYRLNVVIDRNGRAVQCEPAAAPDKLPQFTNRRC